MIDRILQFSKNSFTILVELVPPTSGNPKILLSKLENINLLPIDAFSIATNPLAKPTMDSLATAFLVKKFTKKPVILHCTLRDQNHLSIQGRFWGAKALGIETTLVMTGDSASSIKCNSNKAVNNIDVMSLITTARNADLQTGVVIGNLNDNYQTIDYFKKKVAAGAQFIVSQPVFSLKHVVIVKKITENHDIPVIMGVMPLQNINHAEFLNKKVTGIQIPTKTLNRMASAKNQLDEGIKIAAEMISIAQKHFNGVCIMPPFNRFDILNETLEKSSAKTTQS